MRVRDIVLPLLEVKFKSRSLRRGVTVFHGTSAEDFDRPAAPFWVSTNQDVAQKFRGWNQGEGESRIMVFKTDRALKLLYVDRDVLNQIDDLYGTAFDVHEQAEQVCRMGYDGWIIPDNYQPGDDIMLCYSGVQALNYIETIT